jgi:iron complex outermembrane receptor protein
MEFSPTQKTMLRRPPRPSSIRYLVLCLATLAQAAIAEIHEKSENDFLAELPLVLTASRISQSPLDAPAPVTVIDRETILDSGFTEIHEIFRLIPGFLVADWPKDSPVVVNQGMGDARAKRLLVLLDGRALYDPFQGGIDWQDLPLRLDDIERIEVVRGPNAASYGANAFQGVINIITRAPLGENEQGVVMRAGKRDIGDAYAYLSRGQGDINWRISASARRASNFRDTGKTKEYNEAIQRQTFNGQLIKSLRRDEELSFKLGLSNGENDIGKVTDPSDPLRNASVQDIFFDAGWKRFYAENSEVSLRYYHYGRKERDQYSVFANNLALAPVASLNIQNDVDVRRDDLEFQQIHTWSDTLTGVWGIGARSDAAESPYALAGLGRVSGWQSQLFGNLDWTATPNWLVHAGGMVEKHYNTELLVSPRLALNYRITPTQSLRFSVGRGYRAPTIYEANAREMVTWNGGIAEIKHYADRKLEPETIEYAELGYIAHLQPYGVSIDARVYLNKYTNFIDEQSCILDAESQFPKTDPTYQGPVCAFTAPAGYERPLGYSGIAWIPHPTDLPAGDPRMTDPVYTSTRYGHYKALFYFNSGNIRVHGGDIGIDWRHADLGRFRVSHAITRISASGLGADVVTSANNVKRDIDVESSAPQHTTSVLWSKRLPQSRVSISFGGYWVGEMKWPNDGDKQPAYRRYDLRLGKELKLFGKDDELSFTVQNYNTAHTEFRPEYVVERRAFLTYRVVY